ncbi:group II intron maturase-specific domain-containing protein [Pseudomonas sp. Hz4]
MRKYNGKLLIKPSKANIRAHLAKLREVIKTNKTAKQVNLIGLLNPILRGWANYHSHVVAKKVFNQVDHEVWVMLWRWAVRRHPRKGVRWVKDRIDKPWRIRTLISTCCSLDSMGSSQKLHFAQVGQFCIGTDT